MRTLLWILTGFGILYMVGRLWGTASALKSTLETVGREVDGLEIVLRDLRGEDESPVGS